jgi:hypothetical protein
MSTRNSPPAYYGSQSDTLENTKSLTELLPAAKDVSARLAAIEMERKRLQKLLTLIRRAERDGAEEGKGDV